MLQSSRQKVLSLLMLIVLTLTGSMEMKGADTSDFHFNSGVRYSQWVTKSRMNSFYRNTTADGFAVYDAEGKKTADGKAVLDYVPGLVAKAIVENVQYYSQFNWAQSWALPFFYSMAGYCNDYYNNVTESGGSLDNLNATKMFFGMYELTNTGGAYASKSIASSTKSHAQTALSNAMNGFVDHNNRFVIGTSTPAYKAGHEIVNGGWWHKSQYQNEMWLDGSYMGPALFAQLRNYKGSDIIGSDWTIVYRQIQALWEMCWNPTDKLLYHAFSAKSLDNYSATWAGFDPDDGVFHSASYWGRACGWYFLALVDILEQMDKAGLTGTDNYNTLKGHLANLCEGLAARQDAASGCWYQILDEDGTFHSSIYNNGKNASKHSDTYNYIESSASALFTAGYLKALRLHYIPTATYEPVAKKAYAGLVNNFFAADGNEGVHLFGSCRSAGLGGAAVNGDKWRDGSKAYYLLGHDVARVAKSENVTEGKILGAFILAATEYERLYQNNVVLFEKDLAPSYDLEAGDEISCPATGSGANITYQWYKDGVAVEDATNATIAPTASGAYYCKATSGTTTIQSSTTNVTVPGVDTETPVFTTDLAATATATVGTAKTLTVAASHADGYQWYSNTTASNTSGTEIENATSASYTFTPSAAGTLYYYCVATNSNATGTQSVASAVCTVTVNEAPAETTYTVIFNATTNGGTCATASITQASSGASITLPAATKDGNTFNGWYTASTGGTLRGTSGASYTPTADETLYAQFTPAGGGDDIVWDFSNLSAQDFTSNSSYSFNATDGTTEMRYTAGSSDKVIAKDGSTSGYLKENGNTGSGTVYDIDGTTNIGKTRLIRLYVTGTGTLTINCNGTNNGVYKVYNSNATNTAASSSTALISSLSANTESSEITVTNGLWIETTTKGYITSIVWSPSAGGDTPTPTTYTVSYNMNGHGEEIADVTNVTALPSTLPTPEATGYIFGGWYTNEGLTSAAVAGASISANTTLYAHWTEKAAATVSITSTSGNVTVGSTLDISNYVTAGSSTGAISYSTGDASKATVTNAGVITGEAVGSATITISQAEDANYKAGSVTFTVTVTAAPVPTTNYTVKFWNGETQFDDSQSIEEGSTVSAPATSPIKDGYTFKGWALSEGSTARVLFPYPVYEDVNFYAVWSEDTGGGSGEDVNVTETAVINSDGSASSTVVPNTYSPIIETSGNATNGSSYIVAGYDYALKFESSSGKVDISIPTGATNISVTLRSKSSASNVKVNGNRVSTSWSNYATTIGLSDQLAGTKCSITKDSGAINIYCITLNYTMSGSGQTDDITLDATTDYENFNDYVGEGKNVTLRRNFTEGNWTTLVLPFRVTTEQLVAAFDNADKCELAKIKSMSVDAQGKGSIHYTTVSSIEANKPVLAKIMPNESGKYVFNGVKVVNPESVVSISTDENVEMHGVYKTTGYTQISEDAYFLSGGKFYDWSYLNAMSPFSAYILPVGTNTQSIKSISFAEDATGIENVNANANVNANENESYNLAGQKVGKDYSGMIIIKGKKVLKR